MFSLTLSIIGASLFLLWVINLRRIVPTNEVHILQRRTSTTSYGKDLNNGNVYYQWPSVIPIIGVTVIKLPVSVFDVRIDDYEAYDLGRLPFILDIMAFFRIEDPNTTAQRISSLENLRSQLVGILQGAIRTILASSSIEEIMQYRGGFGTKFTDEVEEQLVHWGIKPVKNIELMDIRDSGNSVVIKNIMEKKKSFIEMESRKEVAGNKKMAEVAEIEARREIALSQQVAMQQVGLRTAETDREVSLANQLKDQVIAEQEKTTTDKKMEVVRVQEVKSAEIKKQAITIQAEAELEKKKKESDGVRIEGDARALATKAMQLASVEAQITLADKIGSNKEYQSYLVAIEQVKANKDVGVTQAQALQHAEVKIIANSSSASDGITKAMDLFSSKGGVQISAMLEGISNSDTGRSILKKIGIDQAVDK